MRHSFEASIKSRPRVARSAMCAAYVYFNAWVRRNSQFDIQRLCPQSQQLAFEKPPRTYQMPAACRREFHARVLRHATVCHLSVEPETQPPIAGRRDRNTTIVPSSQRRCEISRRFPWRIPEINGRTVSVSAAGEPMEPLSLDRLLLFAAGVGNERDTPAGKRRASWEKSFRRSREDKGQNVPVNVAAASN